MNTGILTNSNVGQRVSVAYLGTRTSGNAGTTTTSVNRPIRGNEVGDITIACRVIKPQTASGTLESGWTRITEGIGGTGTQAPGTGQTRIVVDYQTLVGGESGAVVLDQASSPSSVTSWMFNFTKLPGTTWSIASSLGDTATHVANRSVTGGALSLRAGDLLVAFFGTDTSNSGTVSAPTMSATGMTFRTPNLRLTSHAGASQGNTTGLLCTDGYIDTGTEATVAPTAGWTMTLTTCGPTAFVRLRAV